MTKREMEELIDDRANELTKIVVKKYKKQIELIIESHNKKANEFKDTISKLAVDSEVILDNYYLKSLVKSHHSCKEYKEIDEIISKEKAEISKESNELKKRLIIMGLKNKEVASILMDYLGINK